MVTLLPTGTMFRIGKWDNVLSSLPKITKIELFLTPKENTYWRGLKKQNDVRYFDTESDFNDFCQGAKFKYNTPLAQELILEYQKKIDDIIKDYEL